MSALIINTAKSSNTEGLWSLAWKRMKRDRVGMVSMLMVIAFCVLGLASALGLVAADWRVEKAQRYAPPGFAASSAPQRVAPKISDQSGIDQTGKDARPSQPVVQTSRSDDPLAAVLSEIKRETKPESKAGQPTSSAGRSDDPLAGILGEIKASGGSANPPASPSATSAGAPGAASAVVQTQSSSQQLAETLAFGADKWGRDVLAKAIKGTETSLLVGFLAAIVATVLGTLLGALAGYFGGRIDDGLNWFYSIFNAIPYILLVLAIAAVLQSRGILTVVLILGLTGWTTVFRLIRAEYLKHKSRDYVRAADAMGASHVRRMFSHILPNVSHVILVNLSLLVVGFIKSEVILSFLGFGVGVDTVSWGSMLNEAQNELLNGYWWQLLAATLFMGLLVTAFSLFTDALRDALDPKLK